MTFRMSLFVLFRTRQMAPEDYPTFEKKAIAHSVRLVEKLMTKLA